MFSASSVLETMKGPSTTESSGTPNVDRNEAEVKVMTG